MKTDLTRINKKANYAFSFSRRDQELSKLYEKVSPGEHAYQISQTETISSAGIEVRPDDGGKKEALAQLAIWLTANLEKTRQLGDC